MNNFAVLNIAYTPDPTTLSFIVETNNPCHLTCYYTDKEPGRHRTARNQRGLTLPWGAYYCFVAWQSVEQTEPGDTLIHTFEIPDWSFCQTKWFAFRGTVAEVLSPSVSCLFKYHHPGALARLFEHYIVGDDDEKAMFGKYWISQTFTPSEAHDITMVKLLLRRVGFPGNVTASIRPTTFGEPVEPDLCSRTFNGNTLTTEGAGEWRGITFELQPSLPADTIFAIVLRAIGGDGVNNLRWRADSSAPAYPRGMYLTSSNSGLTWDRYPGSDMMFEEWGIAI
jgi:hypothetical protein